MKIFLPFTTGVLLSICLPVAAQQTKAQTQTAFQASPYDYNKPKLFKELPNRVDVTLSEFDNIFSFELGKEVSLPFAQDFVVNGIIVSKAEDVAAQVKSVVIRSTNKQGATLTISRIIRPNNTISYRGRMMSFKHSDAYEIISENGTYAFVKKGLYDLYDE